MLGARNPDFAAVDDITVAVPLGEGRYARSICARVGLGDAKGLQAQLAGGDARQIFRLLRVAAVPQQRAHRVHLGVAGRAVAAGSVHLIENGHGGAQSEAGAAKFLGDQSRKETRFRHRSDELAGIGALTVQRAPVFAGKARAEPANRLADFGKGVASEIVHRTANGQLWTRVIPAQAEPSRRDKPGP